MAFSARRYLVGALPKLLRSTLDTLAQTAILRVTHICVNEVRKLLNRLTGSWVLRARAITLRTATTQSSRRHRQFFSNILKALGQFDWFANDI